jgi:hypothetical protein
VTVKKLVGVGELPPLGAFATAWGFTFLVVAVITEAAPGLGASFAILIATADLLTNSTSVFADVGKQTGPPQSASITPAQQAAQAAGEHAAAAPAPATSPPATNLSTAANPRGVAING